VLQLKCEPKFRLNANGKQYAEVNCNGGDDKKIKSSNNGQHKFLLSPSFFLIGETFFDIIMFKCVIVVVIIKGG